MGVDHGIKHVHELRKDHIFKNEENKTIRNQQKISHAQERTTKSRPLLALFNVFTQQSCIIRYGGCVGLILQ